MSYVRSVRRHFGWLFWWTIFFVACLSLSCLSLITWNLRLILLLPVLHHVFVLSVPWHWMMKEDVLVDIGKIRCCCCKWILILVLSFAWNDILLLHLPLFRRFHWIMTTMVTMTEKRMMDMELICPATLTVDRCIQTAEIILMHHRIQYCILHHRIQYCILHYCTVAIGMLTWRECPILSSCFGASLPMTRRNLRSGITLSTARLYDLNVEKQSEWELHTDASWIKRARHQEWSVLDDIHNLQLVSRKRELTSAQLTAFHLQDRCLRTSLSESVLTRMQKITGWISVDSQVFPLKVTPLIHDLY